jgi:hypothetical protein
MTFTSIRSLTDFIIEHHISFGCDGGFGFLSDVYEALVHADASFDSCSAIEAIRYEAWTDIPGCDPFHTLIAIGRPERGVFSYTEYPYEAAVEQGLVG